MRETQELRKRIDTASELLAVVRTMKAMASVNIHQFESAVESVRRYAHTIELGFQVALQHRPQLLTSGGQAPRSPAGVVLFGSGQGMCGSFNERITDHARDALASRGLGPGSRSYTLVGHRLFSIFEDSDDVRARLELPSAIEGVPQFVRSLMRSLADWRDATGIERVFLFYNRLKGTSQYAPHSEELLPIDRDFLERISERTWDSRTEPLVSMDVEQFFRSLVDEYIYVGLFRACAESLASENAARLASMQSAQRNISERLDELQARYRRTRQSSITAELLDIVGGYEALSDS